MPIKGKKDAAEKRYKVKILENLQYVNTQLKYTSYISARALKHIDVYLLLCYFLDDKTNISYKTL